MAIKKNNDFKISCELLREFVIGNIKMTVDDMWEILGWIHGSPAAIAFAINCNEEQVRNCISA